MTRREMYIFFLNLQKKKGSMHLKRPSTACSFLLQVYLVLLTLI